MTSETPSPAKILAAFFAIYVIWGSTYLAIRFLMDTLPAFSMVGLRFILAGILLGAVALSRGAPRPTFVQARGAAFVGVMLLFGGTGAVVWAIQYLDSGLVALIVAMEPLWLAILMILWPGVDRRPGWRTVLALAVGFAGAAILAAPGDVLAGERVHLPSLLVLTGGSLSWAGGSLISRNLEMPASPSVTSAIQMSAGGLALVVAGSASGEWRGFDVGAVSAISIIAFLYLVVFGSIVAFSAYSWLIRTVNPPLVATHTYVNPAVALFLGWWLAEEAIGERTLLAAALILASVVWMTTTEARHARRRRREAKLAECAACP